MIRATLKLTSLIIPHRSRRYADRLAACPASEGLTFELRVLEAKVASNSRSEAAPHGIKVNGRHVEAVDDGEVGLDIDLGRVGSLCVVCCTKLEDLVCAFQARERDEGRGLLSLEVLPGPELKSDVPLLRGDLILESAAHATLATHLSQDLLNVV